MARDHIVPQTYIREFASPVKQELYYYSKNPWKQKAELGTPAKICYGKDYYYLREDISARYNVAVTHLDKNLLKGYEDQIPKRFKDLITGNISISLEDAQFITEFIVIMKMRSGFFRNRIYSGNHVTNALNKIINELIATYPISESEILQTKELLKAQLSSEKSSGYLHSTSLLSLLNGERDDFFNKIKARILNHRWRLLIAANGAEFISSDNPGFFCTKNGDILNTNFEGDGIFTLPLSSQKALQIDFSDADALVKNVKNVGADTAGVDLVLTINNETYNLSEKTIYGLSREYVEKTIK